MPDIFIIIAGLLGLLTLFLTFKLFQKHDRIVVPTDYTGDADAISVLEEKYAQMYLDKEKQLTDRITIEVEKAKLDAINSLKDEEERVRTRIHEQELKINEKEEYLNQKTDKIDQEKEKIEHLKDELREIKNNLLTKQDEILELEQKQTSEYNTKIEKIAKLSQSDAQKEILDTAKQHVGAELLGLQAKLLEAAEQDADSKAREIVALAVQRCSSEVANEFTLTTVKLPDEDAKGKIIGKGGRNIQWLEKTLGVELVIDETPELVTISGFSSVRRHIAKRTIELLLEDGRIHPGTIEDMCEKAKSEISQEIADAGQLAVNELGIYDFPAKLIRIIGRLKFRTSYGQNMLKHSVEMAKLAKLLAEEMNNEFNLKTPVDVDICVKGALLHDIGKAIDEETQPKGNHISLGEQVCESFGLDWRIAKCVSSHHDESYYDEKHGFCLEAALVDACDNISGGRLGARKETAEAYYQRMNALEKIGETTPGVTKCWIMRGSRELWVFFDTAQVEAAGMYEIVREITKRIQTEVKFPGEIKVVGLWEEKIVEYAV
jgi:ribonuclease Y